MSKFLMLWICSIISIVIVNLMREDELALAGLLMIGLIFAMSRFDTIDWR